MDFFFFFLPGFLLPVRREGNEGRGEGGEETGEGRGVGGSRDRLTLTKRYLETTTIEKLAIWVNTVWLAAGGGRLSSFLPPWACLRTHTAREIRATGVCKFREHAKVQRAHVRTYVYVRTRAVYRETASGSRWGERERKKTQFTRWLNLTDSRKS